MRRAAGYGTGHVASSINQYVEWATFCFYGFLVELPEAQYGERIIIIDALMFSNWSISAQVFQLITPSQYATLLCNTAIVADGC